MKIKNLKKYYIYKNNIISIQKAYNDYDIDYFEYKFTLFVNWVRYIINKYIKTKYVNRNKQGQ